MTHEAPVRRRRWHHIYYLLAAFDLATLSFSLFLNHRLTTVYENSVDQNLEWARRGEAIAALNRQAYRVNAPGNDVFDSMDYEAESRRLDGALLDFEVQLAALRTDIGSRVVESWQPPLLQGLSPERQ